MQTALITTPYLGSGTAEDAIRPQLGEDYPLEGCGATVDPQNGAGVVRVLLTEVTLAAVRADARYVVLEAESVEEAL